MRSREKNDFGGQPTAPAPDTGWRYAFPCADGGDWTFTIPAALVKCVGRYARIPEYARQSYLLSCTPVSTATDMDANASQRP